MRVYGVARSQLAKRVVRRLTSVDGVSVRHHHTHITAVVVVVVVAHLNQFSSFAGRGAYNETHGCVVHDAVALGVIARQHQATPRVRRRRHAATVVWWQAQVREDLVEIDVAVVGQQLMIAARKTLCHFNATNTQRPYICFAIISRCFTT